MPNTPGDLRHSGYVTNIVVIVTSNAVVTMPDTFVDTAGAV
jgi:hypothetical protein